MKRNQKWTCVLLCALLLTGCGAGNAGDTDTRSAADTSQTTDGAAENTAETETEDPLEIANILPDTLDYGGADVRFMVEKTWDESFTGMLDSIWVEEDTGDSVISAVYNRNLKIADYLNVSISLAEPVAPSAMLKQLKPMIASGANDCEVIGGYQVYSGSIAAMDMLLPLDGLSYLHTDAPYWPTAYIDNIAFENTYWVTGDMTTMYTGGLEAGFVNARLWNDHFPAENLYELVREGKWTLDFLRGALETVSTDTNGDGKISWDDNIIGTVFDFPDYLLTGGGVQYSARDTDGTIEIAVLNEHNVNLWRKLYSIYFETPGSLNRKTEQASSNNVMEFFSQGNVFFACYILDQSVNYLREMEDDYYILPCPKYDEAQANYISSVSDNVTMFGLPVTNDCAEMCGAVLEAMAAESYKTLRPAYYESALKSKYSRDADSAAMIDLLSSSVRSDFVRIYSESIGGGIGTTGNGIARVFRTAMDRKTDTIVSLFEAKMATYEKHLGEMLDAFRAQAAE